MENCFEKMHREWNPHIGYKKKFETEFPAKENSLLQALFLAIVWKHPDVRGEGGGLHRRRSKNKVPFETQECWGERKIENTQKKRPPCCVQRHTWREAIITLWKSRARLHWLPLGTFLREATENWIIGLYWDHLSCTFRFELEYSNWIILCK